MAILLTGIFMINAMSSEELLQVEAYASSFLSAAEISTIMKLGPEDSEKLKTIETLEGKAFQRGRLKSKADVYAKIICLAKEGSVPAQEMAMKIIKDSNSD